MKQHTIKIEATGTKEELIKFLEETCIGVIKVSQNLEKKDPDYGIINGSMSKSNMKFTVTTLKD